MIVVQKFYINSIFVACPGKMMSEGLCYKGKCLTNDAAKKPAKCVDGFMCCFTEFKSDSKT